MELLSIIAVTGADAPAAGPLSPVAPATWRDTVDPAASLLLLTPSAAGGPTEDSVHAVAFAEWIREVAAGGLEDALRAVAPSRWPGALAPIALAASDAEVAVFVVSLDVDAAVVRDTVARADTTGLAHTVAAGSERMLVAAVAPHGRAALAAWVQDGRAPDPVTIDAPDAVSAAGAPALALGPGLVHDDVMATIAQEPGVPSPFLETAAFVAAVTTPEIGGYAPISRYFMTARRRRHDLLVAFPEVPGRDAGAFLEWARTRGCEEHRVPVASFAPPPAPRAATPTYRQAGINLVGLVNAELGVGEVARRVAQALAAAHLPHTITAFAGTQSRQGSTFRSEPARYDTNLVCINAESFPAFTQEVGPSFAAGRHTIGLWFWETSHFPSMFDTCFGSVDELWAASDYVVEVLRAAAPPELPVRRMPLPILEPDCAPDFDPVSVGVPASRPYFLCSFDYLSVPERKNPLGAIEAFRRAFAPDEGPVLVVKSINGHARRDAMATIAQAADHRADIVLVDRSLDAPQNNALLARSACYVSLHRSEGYGLNLADALALGVPLVATGATGNLAFCSPDDCRLVRSTPTLVGPGNFPYEADAWWHEPDLDHAAALLRAVADDPAGARAMAARARTRVLTEHTLERTGVFIRDRAAGARAARETAEATAAAALAAAPPPPGFIDRTRSRLRSRPAARRR